MCELSFAENKKNAAIYIFLCSAKRKECMSKSCHVCLYKCDNQLIIQKYGKIDLLFII